MKLRDIVIVGLVSIPVANCESKKDCPECLVQHTTPEGVLDSTQNKNISDVLEPEKEQLNICLSLDGDGKFTHKKVLESIKNPEDVILEFPISQLYNKYGSRSHPLAVAGVKKNFRALLGKGGIEQLISEIPQKLSPRTEKITSDTKYLIDDTLRFKLINSELEGEFPKYLSEQLQENGFEGFSDTNITKKENQFTESQNLDKSDFYYDIVVKKLSNGQYGGALYRNGELFMASYVSVGLTSKKTKTGKFIILRKSPYYFSRKYKSPMPEGLEFDERGFWMHQGDVTRGTASHGCVRWPGFYISILFSLVDEADVFISKNLYRVQ